MTALHLLRQAASIRLGMTCLTTVSACVSLINLTKLHRVVLQCTKP